MGVSSQVCCNLPLGLKQSFFFWYAIKLERAPAIATTTELIMPASMPGESVKRIPRIRNNNNSNNKTIIIIVVVVI